MLNLLDEFQLLNNFVLMHLGSGLAAINPNDSNFHLYHM